MLLLSKQDIRKSVTMKDMIEAVQKAFIMMSEERCQVPLRTVISHPDGESSFLFMPAYAAEMDAAAVKVVDIFPGNIDKGLSSAPGQILLIDGDTGYVSALLDGTCVTQLRTGASTGAAFEALAKKTCRKGALIGTGGQAMAQLEAMLAVRRLEEVSIYDLNEERRLSFAVRAEEIFSSDAEYNNVRITAAATSDECIDDADLIITVTPSAVPVFDGAKVKPGATVSAVGTYEPHKHELDSGLLPRAAKIVCDWKDAVLSESGDLLIPIAEGLICKEDIFGNLGDILSGKLPGRENDEEIIVYETVGIAMQDLAAAKAIYDKALAKGAGTVWGEE